MITIIVNGSKIDPVELSFSSVDPGGFETASFAVVNPLFDIMPGHEVAIFEGTEYAWHGRVEEPGRQLKDNQLSFQVNCVGYGTELKENPFSFIWVDSDMSNWQGTSIARRIVILANNDAENDATVSNDPSTGLPALTLGIEGSWAAPIRPFSEGFWDAGFGNSLSALYIDWRVDGTRITTIAGGATWTVGFYLVSDDIFTSFDHVDPTGSSGSVVVTTSATNRRYAAAHLDYGSTPAGGDGANWEVYATNMAVFGSSELSVQSYTSTSGTVIRGLYVSDIISDIIRRSNVRFSTNVAPSTYITNQASFKTPADPESMISTLNGLLGWHWGVWEPSSAFSTQPTFWFQPPPRFPTVATSLRDCTEVDISESYSSYHDSIQLTYTDPLGLQAIAVASKTNAGVLANDHHTLQFNIGNSTTDAANAIAAYILTLDQLDNRIAGSVVLPTVVSDGRLAHLLRPGRDKLKLTDFPSSLSKLDTEGVFRINRITTNVSEGIASSTVEFDRGADLIEVLQSRLVQGNSKIGF